MARRRCAHWPPPRVIRGNVQWYDGEDKQLAWKGSEAGFLSGANACRRHAAQDCCNALALLHFAAVRSWVKNELEFPGRGDDGLTKRRLDG